jgi:hypothetical protein
MSSFRTDSILTLALFTAVRFVEGVVGLVVPLAVSNGDSEMRKSFEWFLGLPCSLLHDLGTFCIVLSLTRALFHALDLWDWTFLNILRRLWGWILVFLPIPGYFVAGMVVPFMYGDNPDLQYYDSKTVNGYSVIAYSILRANIISLGATLLAMTPFFLFVFIKRRKGQLWSSSTASATAIIFFPTLMLMIVYLVNDMLRFIINHIPTITQHFALSLAPEVLVTAIWLALARHIGKCDKEFVLDQENIREFMGEKWNNEINKAFDAHAGGVKLPMEKYGSAEQTVEGVYDCAMYRLERLHQNYMEDEERATRNFVEEARLLVEDAKQNARLIAGCLVLAPCENHPLFGRQLFPSTGAKSGRRLPYLAEKTGKLVLEAMRKDEAMKILNSEELKWAVSDIVKIHLS